MFPLVWRLVRNGFLVHEDGELLHVRGLELASDAEPLTELVLAAVLQPARRARITDRASLHRAMLEEARSILVDDAERRGRVVSVATPETRAALPSSLDHLDHLLDGSVSLDLTEPEPDASTVAMAAETRPIVEATLATLDADERKIAELRFVRGLDVAATASAIVKGRAFVRGRERRIRHAVRHAIRRAHPEWTLGAAELEIALSGGTATLAPPLVTVERLRTRVLRRTHRDEPTPYDTRVAWAVGSAVLASALLAVWAILAKAG